jgi:hypothetical protein
MPLWYDPETMAPRLPELIGRAMIDADFLAELQRAPETILAHYELNDDERATVLGALARLAATPAGQRVQVLSTALIRRVAT